MANHIQKIQSTLKKHQSDVLDGYFIAKIEVRYRQKEKPGISFKNLLNNISSAIINELVSDNQIVNVVLIQKNLDPLPQKLIDIPNQKPILVKKFTLLALNQFLQISGDQNKIHFGENPVVPGLLILENLAELFDLELMNFTIKFYNPLHLQNELTVYKTAEKELIGFNNNLILFKLNQK